MVSVIVQEAKIDQMQTALLVIGIFENERDFFKSKGLNSTITAAIIELIENKEFKRSFGSNIIFHMMGKGLIKKIMLIGLGTREKFTYENARIIAGKAALEAKELGVEEFCILPFMDVDEALIEAISEGVLLSLYTFNRYKTSGKQATTIPAQATIVVNSDSAKFQAVVDIVNLITQAVNYARDLSNLPPNECPPSQIASLALALDGEYGIKTRILERYEMESIGLNGIVSVGKGSNNPPKLIILEYYGNVDHHKPYLLVGKAVTFDTGGISLKPGDRMDEMKFDKCGGCSILGILKAIASLGLPVNVIGIIPSVENMPSSTSYRPGDIIRMYNGKTVEILNTDAEGRIILADAMAYGVAIFNPQAIIDLATLTGACVIALGANVAAVIGTSKYLAERLSKISEKTGERIWGLPLHDEYYEQIKSTVADLKNIGGRPGGAITAAAFLSNFTNDIPWVHLDIAGTAWTQEGTFERSYNPKGATGFGIRTVVKFLMEVPNK
ncbi:MAG: leucyl aminopeptidase [Candidatus Nitrosopolaris wilkensis]|nr:MAG: leucyl aminopeptidase [Candidatus Nitrosopolaris wilkensis]